MAEEDKRLIGYKNDELTSSKTLLGYSSNDYWYVNPSIKPNLPTIEQCNGSKPLDGTGKVFLSDPYADNEWLTKCNDANFASNEQACIKKELCKNRDYAERTRALQLNHGGSDQKYVDTNKVYISEYLNIFNLGIGVIALAFFIYQNVKNVSFSESIQPGVDSSQNKK